MILALVLPPVLGSADDLVVSEIPAVVIQPDEKPLGQSRVHTTDRVDVLTRDRIEMSSFTTLNEAVDKLPGVDSQDFCVNCGAKRITINGLRGDHTSVLVDGIPLYSAVTSVYGFDAIPMQSVQEIEVKRGTGGALINPEAIGGTLNIVTLDPLQTGSRASVLFGDRGTKTFELLHNHVAENYRVSLGGETGSQEAWDVDRNGLAESPFRNRYSVFLKQILTLSPDLQWVSRLSFADLEIVGGNTSRYRLTAPITTTASDMDFDGGDVRRPYRGDIRAISEYVGVQRSEATSKLTSRFDDANTLEWNLAGALYKQQSFYMHAFDYETSDTTLYSDARWSHQISDQQLMTLGVSYRNEVLRSSSRVLFDRKKIPKDDFDYSAYSLFGQYDLFFSNGIEFSAAVRLEKLENKWLELNSLNRDVASPRLLAKWQHTEHFSQQAAYGYGYRMPLTSIESAHGAYDGFVVNITELERSHSLVYSVSYNTPSSYLTPSVHYTNLSNMAYPLDSSTAHSGPLRFVSDTQSHEIVVYDVLVGHRPTANWLLEMSYESFNYSDAYKAKLPVAAIEQRINIRSEFEGGGMTFLVSGSWIGARTIGKYFRYQDHYNISDGLLGVSDQKWQNAPSFWQWDASIRKKIDNVEVTFGVQNLLDFTQTGAGDSPAMWHLHGDHTHLDNRHVWGPNRGREYFLKVVSNF